MSEIVFKCRRHGERTEEQVYRSNDKATIRGFRYKCKECTYAATRKRPCKVHGMIADEDRLASGHCSFCSLAYLKGMSEIRDNDRASFNEKKRLKKEDNPELAKLESKYKYERNVVLYGKDKLNEGAKARRYGLTIEQYKQMFVDQNNMCAICHQPETRIFTQRSINKEMQIAKLCLDHCHVTNKVRGLLCHDCNTAIGKMKDNIDRLQSAINYLKKHEHQDRIEQ